jgi:hypothetical protein
VAVTEYFTGYVPYDGVQQFCSEQRQAGIPAFGCPVQYRAEDPLRLAVQ